MFADMFADTGQGERGRHGVEESETGEREGRVITLTLDTHVFLAKATQTYIRTTRHSTVTRQGACKVVIVHTMSVIVHTMIVIVHTMTVIVNTMIVIVNTRDRHPTTGSNTPLGRMAAPTPSHSRPLFTRITRACRDTGERIHV